MIVTGYLEKGKLADIEGMKTKFVIWVKVTSIFVDDPQTSKVYFTAGMKRSRPRDAYEVHRDGISMDMLVFKTLHQQMNKHKLIQSLQMHGFRNQRVPRGELLHWSHLKIVKLAKRIG